MFFHKNINKETTNILIQENKRLKRQNQKLQESLDDLQRYKDEYKKLIVELNNIKKTYISKIKDFDKLEMGYKKELDKIIGQKNK